MGSVVLDANVVVGFLEPTDALHERCVKALRPWLRDGDQRLLSTFVYAEALVRSISVGADRVVEDFVDAAMTLVAPDRPIARRAAEVRATAGLTLGDAIVVATALHHRAELLTFDDRVRRAWSASA